MTKKTMQSYSGADKKEVKAKTAPPPQQPVPGKCDVKKSPTGGPSGRPPTGLDAGKHAAAQRAAQQADVLKEGVFSALMASALGLDRFFDTSGFRVYLACVFEDLGDPADPIERMLIEQLCLAHFRTAQLHVGAGQAQGSEAVKIYNAVTARMLGEMRRTVLALKAYRTDIPTMEKRATLKLLKAAQ